MTTQLFDVKQDYIFKRIFGSISHPGILISFLNACFKGSVKITDIKINNSKIEKEFIEDSFSRLDILATTDKNELINIEMQRADEKNMVNRSLYYWAKTFSGQYNGKQEYENIPRTVCINVLDFRLDELREDPAYHNVFSLKNEHNNKLTNAIELQFIELPKLILSENDDLSQWISFIKDPNSQSTIQAERKIHAIHEAKEELTRLSRDPAEAERYRQRADSLAEKSNALLGAEAKGKAEEAASIAKKLIMLGLDNEQIAIATRLKELDIERLREE
jgi:predicted transposase/invertase (TIGR01784 family)